MAQTVQVLRTSTNTPPAVLAAGALSVELGTFTKLWVGAPAGGNRLLLSSDPADAPAAGAAYLKLSGGTLTGLLTLSGAPTNPLHAATKAYADGISTADRSYADTQDALKVAKAGDTMTGQLTIAPASGGAQLNLTKTAGANAAGITAYTGANARWFMQIGDTTAEGGSNAGSNFAISRYADAGTFIDTPLTINRATGLTTLAGNLTIAPAAGTSSMVLRKAAAGQQASITGYTGANARWDVILGTNEAEAGSNAGSNFYINRYTDAGAYISSPLSINRTTGQMTLGAQLNVAAPIAITGANALSINGHTALSMPGTGNTDYTHIFTPTGAEGIYLGSGTDPANYYQNTKHTFRSLGASQEFAAISNAGISIGSLSTMFVALLTVTGSNTAGMRTIVSGVRQWTCGGGGDGSFSITDDSAARTNIACTTAGQCWNQSGTWLALSDVRAKRNIVDYRAGLAEVLKLRPVMFEWNGELGSVDDGITQYGLIAQEVEGVMPELVAETTQTIPRDEELGRDERSYTFKGVDPGRAIYALINATKELAQRVAVLEGKPS